MVRVLWLRCKTRIRAELHVAGVLLMLFFVWNIAQNMFEELEPKQSIVIHHDQVTHPLLNQLMRHLLKRSNILYIYFL